MPQHSFEKINKKKSMMKDLEKIDYLQSNKTATTGDTTANMRKERDNTTDSYTIGADDGQLQVYVLQVNQNGCNFLKDTT